MNHLDAFADELEKIAWGGTYYHGTSPKAEEAILREGLRADKGGTGAVGAFASRATGSGSALAEGLVGRLKKDTTGKITMSRSKTLAKVYGTVMDKDALKRVGRTAKVIARRNRGKTRLSRIAGGFKGLGAGARKLVKTFIEHQPLEISGKSLKGLTRDTDHRLLGVQTPHDVPARLIRKARASRIGKMLSRAL